VRELRSLGSVRGVSGNRYPYRDHEYEAAVQHLAWKGREATGFRSTSTLSDGLFRVVCTSSSRFCERL